MSSLVDTILNYADNWARLFVVITYIGFVSTDYLGIVPNLIFFELFVVAIGYFALTGKMAEMFGPKKSKDKPTF